MMRNQSSVAVPTDKQLKRSDVCWVDFGVNVGWEFGGDHPAIILRSTSNLAYAAPLSSKLKAEGGIHVRVDRVNGRFEDRTRLVNVLQIRPISLQRVDFSRPIGHVTGDVLNAINSALIQNGIGPKRR